jgi:tetratricopeptide (TPR) repeat protein
MPPPPSQPLAVQPDEVSTAKAPPVAHAATHVSEPTNGHSSGHATEPEVHAHDEHAHEDRAPVSRPLSAPPPADLDEGFFDHGERAAADAHREAADLENYDEKMAQKNSPEARARRAKNWRYVLFAGAACVLLLLIADVKNRSSRGDSPAVEAPVVVNVAPPSAVPPKVEPTPVAVVVPPASSADEAVVVAPAASGSAQAAGAASGAPADSKWVATTASAAAPGTPPGTPPGPPPGATPPAAAAAEPTAEDRKSAAQEKRTAQSFLDQGAFAKAVEAGEHSVALDPADGEAWLLLGAAYQSMGKGAEARRTFTSCVAEGKRGPINECRAMLR